MAHAVALGNRYFSKYSIHNTPLTIKDATNNLQSLFHATICITEDLELILMFLYYSDSTFQKPKKQYKQDSFREKSPCTKV